MTFRQKPSLTFQIHTYNHTPSLLFHASTFTIVTTSSFSKFSQQRWNYGRKSGIFPFVCSSRNISAYLKMVDPMVNFLLHVRKHYCSSELLPVAKRQKKHPSSSPITLSPSETHDALLLLLILLYHPIQKKMSHRFWKPQARKRS